jgi:hypothetical protein
MSENDASNSILGSVKDSLGIIGYDVFDKQLIMHINSVFADLNQMGVGPSSGFSIADGSSQWSAFTDDDVLLNNVKSYMFLRVKMLFDNFAEISAYLDNAVEIVKVRNIKRYPVTLVIF